MAETRTDVEIVRDDDPSKGEVIAAGLGIFALVSLFGGVIWMSIKDEKRMLEESKAREEKRLQKLEEKKAWLNKEYADGNVIYELKDGSYLVVPRVSEQRRVIK